MWRRTALLKQRESRSLGWSARLLVSVATPGLKDEADVSPAELLSRRSSYGYTSPTVFASGEVRLPEYGGEVCSPALVGEQLQKHQSVAAKLNYFSMDRPDLLYSVKELTRKLSRPSEDG